MVSSKYSSRRHVPQRPPICHPPLKKIEQIPIPPWPPTATRAQGYITYSATTHTLDITITPSYLTTNVQLYSATQNQMTITYTIQLNPPELAMNHFATTINGQQIAFGAYARTINPATPINEQYPPWIKKWGPPATGQLTISTA